VLDSNTWYYIAGVWDASEQKLDVYVNGVIGTEEGNNNYANGNHEALNIGQQTDSSRKWMGYIDEFMIYDRQLSGEQIYQYYLCTKDGPTDQTVMVSDETNIGDIWQCIVTPNDGTQDDDPVESNTLQIINYLGGD